MHDPNMLVEELEDFNGAALPTAFVGTVVGDATVAVNAAATVPGEAVLTLAATNEAELARLDFNDKLSIPLSLLQSIEMRVKVDSTLAAAGSDAVSVAFGVASAHNATLDSIAAQALFRHPAAADNKLFCESDDGVTDNDDKDTGFNLEVGSYRRYKIDFTQLTDVKFYAEVNGVFRRVCTTVTFDMSGYTGAVQPYARIEKSASTDVNVLRVDYIARRHSRA